MRKIFFLLFCCLAAGLSARQTVQTPQAPRTLSIEEAVELLYYNNNAIKLTDKSIEIARAEKQKLNSFWYPSITAGGAFVHLSNDIEARESIQELAKPFEGDISKILGVIQELLPSVNVGEIAAKIGSFTFSFPLLDQNLSTIDANIVWPVFTGGKRIYSGKIGNSLVESAQLLKELTTESQLALLTASYYGLKLAREVVSERELTLRSMELLYNNARKLEQNGMINRAELLVAKVAREEAWRELESARENSLVAQKALLSFLSMEPRESISVNGAPPPSWKPYIGNRYYDKGYTDHFLPDGTFSDTLPSEIILPVSHFFTVPELAPLEHFKTLITEENSQLQLIRQQQNISENQRKIAGSAYLPNIAFFGKQSLYTYQIPKNLSPRNVIGVGFVWNLFDGLGREKSIQVAKKSYELLEIRHKQASLDLLVLADKLYSQITDATNNIRALKTSVELSRELLKVREKSFLEGMATSSDVVDARVLLSKVNIAMLLAYFQYDVALANLLALCGDGNQFLDYYRKGEAYR